MIDAADSERHLYHVFPDLAKEFHNNICCCCCRRSRRLLQQLVFLIIIGSWMCQIKLLLAVVILHSIM